MLRSVASLFLINTFTPFSATAQRECATALIEEQRFGNQKVERFEHWIRSVRTQTRASSTLRTENATYVIPVVVHVIHNGEPIGTGTNVSDAQIESQIAVLNRDFQRQNFDTVNTPPAFEPLTGEMDIQFVLAKQDPQGFPTDGIVRVDGGRNGWTLADESTFKALSYWRADWYLNIWVIRFSDNFIGFAQLPLPEGTGLPGLEDAVADSLTDGVVLDYTVFGSVEDGNFDLDSQFDRGRTGTHEVGHYFGLRHIWGDGTSCTTDYVADTPLQSAPTRGCPSHPQRSCDNDKMFQNYMDYTDDACMNLFTMGQVERMEIVINNAPRRKSLLTSPGAIDPTEFGPFTDVALVRVKSPGPVVCTSSVAPVLQIKNAGTTLITSFDLEINLNQSLSTAVIENINLEPEDLLELELPNLSLQLGTNTLTFSVLNPNGSIDQRLSNNTIQRIQVVNKETEIIPLRQNFDQSFNNWTAVSQDNDPNWQPAQTNFNTSLVYNAFNNPNRNEEAWLVSPVLNMANTTEASLFFDGSYAERGQQSDRLLVLGSPDCGVTYPFTLLSLDLADITAQSSATAWKPIVASEWNRIYVNLNALATEPNARIAFVFTNQNSNNFYLDNLEFFVSDDPTPPEVAPPYLVYGTSLSFNDYAITFDLPDRADVSVFLYNVQGQLLSEHRLGNILNQTLPLDLSGRESGIYLLRILIGNNASTAKIFVSR